MAERAEKNRPTPETNEPRALQPEEYDSAISLLNSVMRPNGPSDILKEYPLVLGKKNLRNMRVIVRDGEVVSHAAIYFSNLRSGNLVFKVGGINSVATHPSHRRQGLARKVMLDCIKIMEDASAHLSILWTARHEFYRQLGYETAGSSYLYRLGAADLADVPDTCGVVPYSPRYLPAVIKIHNRETLRTERTAKEYETYLGLPKTRALLAVRDGEVTAYAVMGKGEDLRYCVHDWGGNPQDLLCLVHEFNSTTESGGIMVLTPGQPNEFTRLLRQANIPSAFEYLSMIRVIDVEGLSSLIGDDLSGRLGKNFNISRTDSGVKIAIGDEQSLVTPERNLVRVLFGPESPSSLLTGLSQETLSALDEALPISLYVWGLDSV
jgi:predicted N-acetyltransferase YhbS